MSQEPHYGYWEVPATVLLFDTWGGEDRDAFKQLMERSLEEIALIDDTEEIVRDRVTEHWTDALRAFEKNQKILALFCWYPKYNTSLPFFFEPFLDDEVDKIKSIVKLITNRIVDFKCIGFELKYFGNKNRLLRFAIQAALELELSQINIDALIAKDTGYDA